LYLGCGRGVWKRELASFNPIICADINPQLFDYVKEGYADVFFEMDRMRFVTVKMRQLQGMEDNSVEFVFSWETFPLMTPDEIKAMLKEVNRVLKPGGRAMIHFADAFNSEDYAWIEQKHWAYMDRWKFIDLVRNEELVPLKIRKKLLAIKLSASVSDISNCIQFFIACFLEIDGVLTCGLTPWASLYSDEDEYSPSD
jgi:ubiquinone/menaquinone biosynthesis C-methylase UbiE